MLKVDNRFNNSLSSIFRKSVISELLLNGKSKYIKSIISESNLMEHIPKSNSLATLYDKVYNHLFYNYRSEYIYKNLIALENYRRSNKNLDFTLISEFRVESTKTDLVELNDTSIAYEIKTEIDSFNRLKSQIFSYLKVFDLIYIVTHHTLLKRILPYITGNIGLIMLTEHGTLEVISEAKSNKSNVEPMVVMDCLRRKEYCRILTLESIPIPNVPNTKIYTEVKKLFSKIDPVVAHDRMVETLIERERQSNKLRAENNGIPDSLTFTLHNLGLNQNEMKKLSKIFQSRYSISLPR